MPQSVRTAKDVFLEAIELTDSTARERFVAEACRNDQALRQRVDALILAHERPESLLDQPAGNLAPTKNTPVLTEKPGTQIGPYKLLQQIGEGGMGVVYMAEQKEPVKRRVALKIIKPGMDTRQVIARFEAERQALAMMDHPNIAKVLDAGQTESGRPYFVMELVKGFPITEYCDEHQQSLRERLELFVPVCQSVQHAHQKGIIHRDIKPSNVLVCNYDDRPMPKIIDFGVAKAIEHSLTEKTIFTEFGQVVGTPEYMSPEQARLSQLDIDTRSDIYSLGVLLYELLAGETPFDRQRLRSVAFDELLRIIREEEPPRPSIRLSTSNALPSIAANRHIEPGKLGMLVRGELDWIVMKALEKDRTRRYETANGFAVDIHRYLDGKAIEAGPPSGWYRFRKVVRQHRAVLLTTISAVVVLVATVVGLAFHSYRIGQAYREISRVNEVATRAERGRTVQLAKSMLSEARWRRQSGQEGHRIEASRLISEAAAIILPRKPSTELILQLRNEWIAASALAVDLERVRTFDRTLLGFDPRHRVYAWCDHEGRAIVCRTDDDHERARLVLSSDETALPWAAEFSDDLRFAMIAYDDSAMRLWDLERELPVLKVNVPSGGFAADFSPGNCLLAYGDRSGAIRLLDLSTSPPRELPSTFTASGLSGMPRRLRFDPSGERIAVSCGHGGALRSARDDAPSISDTDAANSAEHSPILADGSFDASRGQLRRTHGGIDVLELSSAERLLSIPYVPCSPGNVYWSPDGRFLAFGGSDFHIRIWNVEQNCLHALLEGHRWGGISASFSHEGDFVTSRSWDGTSRFWDFHSGQELLRTRAGAAHIRRPGDTRVFTATPDGGTLWDIAASSTLSIVPSSIARQTEEYGVWVHPEDRLSAAACGDGVHLFDLAARTEIAVLPLNGCRAALFSPRDGSLLTASSEGLHRWSLKINAVSNRVQLSTPTTLTTHIGTWNSCASVTPDGMYLATIADNRVEVHDLDQGTVRLLDGSYENVRSISISPDGQWVATGNWHGAGVKLWNVTEGRLADEDLWPRVRDAGVKFSPDGSRFAASSRSHYRVWQVGTWELLHEGPRDDGGMGRKLAFSPDGKVLAISVSSQVVRLLDSATGNELATLNSPYAFYVDHLAFNTEGNVLIALDRSLHVWNLGAIRKGLDPIGLDWNLPPCPASLVRKEVQPLMIDASEIRRGLTSVRTGMEDREAYRKLVTVHERIRDEEATAGEVSAETHWRLAVSQLAAQDIDGYRTTCKAMLRHFGIDSEDSWAKEMTAWVVALYENPEKDVSQAIAVALQLVEQRRNATNLRVLAACLFRAGRVEEAHQMLREALPGSKRPVYVFCLLALTSQQLGRVDEAKTWLDKVDLSIHANEKVYWVTRATIHLLRNQALAATGG